jgi:hypothetical protein
MVIHKSVSLDSIIADELLLVEFCNTIPHGLQIGRETAGWPMSRRLRKQKGHSIF